MKTLATNPRIAKSDNKTSAEGNFYTKLGDFCIQRLGPYKVFQKIFITESLSDDALVHARLGFSWPIWGKSAKEHIFSPSNKSIVNVDAAELLPFKEALWYMQPNDTLMVVDPDEHFFRVASKKFVRTNEETVTVEVTFEDSPPPVG